MKKLWHALVGVVVIMLSGSGVISAQTMLRLGTDDWAPYEFRQDNRLTGYSVEIVQQVFRQMGVDIASLELLPWARAERMVFEGEIDALFSVTKSQLRENACFFPTEPLTRSDWVLFIRQADAGRLTFHTFADLQGKQIGVVRDHAYTPEFWEFLKKAQNYQEVTFDLQNFKKLAADRVDYVASEYVVGMSIIKELGLTGEIVALTEQPLKTAELYVMFSQKTVSAATVAQFSEALRQFKTTPAYQEIYARYLQ